MKPIKQIDVEDSRKPERDQTGQAPRRSLTLDRESIRILSDESLQRVAGGWRLTVSRADDGCS